MQKTLAILNELEAAGLVERYAIGGAMAGFFYAESGVSLRLPPQFTMSPASLIAPAVNTLL